MAKQAQAPPPVVDSHWLRLLRGPSRLIGHWLARRPTALVVAWCLLLTLPGIATGTLWRTEGLRARVAAEMYAGQLLIPTLYGEPFLTKPPGHYWAIVLCSWPMGGVCEVSSRLPSVIAALATVLLLAGLVRRYAGARAGLIAGLLVPVSLVWLDKAPSAEIDAVLIAWVAAAIAGAVRALDPAEPRPTRYWLLAWAAVAGGTLTKWTAPAFFYLTILPFALWRGQVRRLLAPGHWLGIALWLGLCGLWAGLVTAQIGSDALIATVSREAAQRFDPHHAGRAYPWAESLSYPLVVWAAALPISAVALGALVGAFARGQPLPPPPPGQRLLRQLGVCWVVPNVLFWTWPAEHAARYACPVAPGFAILAALAILRLRESTARRWLWTLLLGWLLVKVVFVVAVMPGRTATAWVRETAAAIAQQLGADEILYLFRLKDEGMMFYYGRAVRRLTGPDQLPAGRPIPVLLNAAEWSQLQVQAGGGPLQVTLIAPLRDQQGDPIYLTRINRRAVAAEDEEPTR
jgi:4-amino-4-deoxy-L-arabinose transferase-like glycosyltransferase